MQEAVRLQFLYSWTASCIFNSYKKQIRTHLRKEVRSDLLGMVHFQGLEPWARWLRVSCSTNWARSAHKCGPNRARYEKERRQKPRAAAPYTKMQKEWWPVGESNSRLRRERPSSWPLDQRAEKKEKSRHLPIFPGRLQPSIFGTTELNYCVRNGNRWDLCVIGTGYEYANAKAISLALGYSLFFRRCLHPQNWTKTVAGKL